MKKILISLIVLIGVIGIIVIMNYDNWFKDNEENNNYIEQDGFDKMIADMSLEEKVGQMFMVRCPKERAAELAKEYHLGGYILFSRDFEDKTKDEVISNIALYQEGLEIPMFIGVDEEGGTVNRISKFEEFRSEPFKSSQELYAEGGFTAIYNDTIDKAKFLKQLGINVNFAPVADVSTDSNDYIYARSFGMDATATSEYVSIVVAAMKEENIGSVLKHFPGYGNNVDTHTGIAIDDRSYETFENSDFLPFQVGINQGADIVLVSHNIVNSMDPDYPASLSKKIHDILRDKLNFAGVIITDDLYMDAIKDYQDNEEVAVKAVLAGNDLICTTDFEKQISAVIAAVQEGVIKEKQIDVSVKRILKLKSTLHLI